MPPFKKRGLRPMITGRVTEKEYIAAHRLHGRKMQSVLRQSTLIVFLIGIVLFFAVSAKVGVIVICAALGGLLGEFIQSRFILQPTLRRRYAQVRGRVDVTYSWDEGKIFITTEHGHAARSWTDFIKAKENDELILLYINDALYEIIAKRWFSDASDQNTFRKHLKFVS
jgi:hypothetical protein